MSDRVAVVTGAASGIGRAIAERLVDDGVSVVAVDLNPADDGPGEPLAADLTTREGNRAAVDAALERFGRLDAVVANAGFQHVAPVAEFPEDKWDGPDLPSPHQPLPAGQVRLAGAVGLGRGPLHRHRLGARAGGVALQGRIRER